MGKAASILLRNRKLLESRSCFEKQLEYSIKAGGTGGAANMPHRVVLSMVLVNIAAGDNVAAGRALDMGANVSNFQGSEECNLGSCLIDAMERGESKTAVEVLRSPIFKFMDNEVIFFTIVLFIDVIAVK